MSVETMTRGFPAAATGPENAMVEIVTSKASSSVVKFKDFSAVNVLCGAPGNHYARLVQVFKVASQALKIVEGGR